MIQFAQTSVGKGHLPLDPNLSIRRGLCERLAIAVMMLMLSLGRTKHSAATKLLLVEAEWDSALVRGR